MATKKKVEVERPYTLRSLKNKDVWAIIRILGMILPDDMKKAFVQVASKEKTLKEIGLDVGVDLVTLIAKNAYKAQDEVDSFCADMAGITVEELNDMEFGTTLTILSDVFGNAKNTSFFKALSKLLS